ncbi:UNVERIFIED_CONTAM: hypothetical protein Sangu_2631600 [Sesamum angustifolium]|uniref:Uncharacterized protein n=1 Tax=Sesamum angustifolium TaxID=2727405 RepID=A0AAW2J3M3_9LAMI
MTVIQCGLCFRTLYHNNSHCMLEVWGRSRAGCDLDEEHTASHHGDNRSGRPNSRPGDRESPIVISDSIASLALTHTHVDSWDEEGQVANATEGARLRRTTSVGPRWSLDRGSVPAILAPGQITFVALGLDQAVEHA